MKISVIVLALGFATVIGATLVSARQPPSGQKPPTTVEQQKPPAAAPATPARAPAVAQAGNAKTPPPVAGVPLPPDFVLGPDDVVHVEFWRDKDMTADATVRPDGKISLPLLNDIQAGGLTPDQLRENITEAASRLLEEPTAIVVVKEIRSRKVFITGEVNKPGAYLLNDKMTVLQLIATAGGLTEFAKKSKIVVMRNDAAGQVRPAGQPVTLRFNYDDVLNGKNLRQNIELKPGDTIIVP